MCVSTTAELPNPADASSEDQPVAWPPKHDVLGVLVSATTYDELVNAMIEAAHRRESAVVSFHAVHAIMEAASDPALLEKVNRFSAIAPDGQPVRWALNQLHRAGLRERVYGPETMARLCDRAAREGVPVYLYGGSPEVIERLQQELPVKFPALRIVGAESPPFRPLTEAEDTAVVERINGSGAGIVFIGLGCPKQDHFAADHADRLRAVQACVGAAFDFHAGSKSMAPHWMQRAGLEWLFRLASEPRRLWRRYLYTNSAFVAGWLRAAMKGQQQATKDNPILRKPR